MLLCLTEFLLPSLALEYAILEKRIYNDICRLDLRVDEFFYGLGSLSLCRMVQKKRVIALECSWVSRDDLVHLHDLIDQISVTALIVERLDRF